MPFKKAKKFVKKITKPISKVLDKVVPNEIKPFLPFAAALTPFMFAGGLGGTTLGQQMFRRALLTGGTNLAAQLAQEGSEGDFSGISTLLAAGTGALSAPGVPGGPTPTEFFADKATGAEGFKKFGLKALEKTAGGLESAGEVLRDPFSASLKEVAGAAITPVSQGSIDLGMATARKALKDYEDELAEYERISGEAQVASDDARRTAIRAAMIAGGHSEDVISETFSLLGLKDGGRVGLREGGLLQQLTGQANQITIRPGFQPISQPAFARPLLSANQMPVFPRLRELEQGIDTAESDLGSIRSRLGNQEGRLGGLMGIQPAFGLQPLRRIQDTFLQNTLRSAGQMESYKDGGITGLKDGGMLDLEGKEMDLRGGGFVPIGKKERADDVPARLSKNEFVMTADAVRAAGGGDVNKGAKRMYETMNKLEARA